MPQSRKPKSLVETCCGEICSLLIRPSLIRIEKGWNPKPRLSSPKTSPISPNTRMINPMLADYEEREETRWKKIEQVRKWLKNVPLCLLDQLLQETLRQIEVQIEDDKDRKLILTLINIEKMKQSDLFFGVFSLLEVLQGFEELKEIGFSTRLWFCLSEYSEIVKSYQIRDKLCDTLPKLKNLSKLNIAHIATDKLCFLVAQNLSQLQELSLDQSSISDKAIKFICGLKPQPQQPQPFETIQPSHQLDQLVHQQLQNSFQGSGTVAESSQSGFSSSSRNQGNLHLRVLNLEGCKDITEHVVWIAFMRLPELGILRYHQTSSIAEILTKECSQLKPEELKSLRLKLEHFYHPFPYGLNVFEDLLSKVSIVCPNITMLNIVTIDACLSYYTNMKNLSKVTIEIEDCFGLGLQDFLLKMGKQLQEFSVSCWSDRDSMFLPEGGDAYESFNVGLLLASKFCSGQKLKKLSIAGCGLVSNLLQTQLEAADWLNHKIQMDQLESLIFLSYEDDNPMQTCRENLLLNFLKGCPQIKTISLEGNFSTFMKDDFFTNLMSENQLRLLEILDFQGGPVNLTMKTARNVIENLHFLREIRVSNWKLNEREIRELKVLVDKNGWILNFRS